MVDLLIIGGTVVSLDSNKRRFKEGAVAVEGNKITGIGKATDFRKKDADRIIDARGGLILPGFIDTHTHLQSSVTTLRGYGLEAPGGGLYKRLMTIRVYVPDQERYDLAMGGGLTSLRFGSTTVADWDFGENMVARAVKDLGLRGLLSEYTYGIDFHKTRDAGHHAFSREEEERTLALALKFVDEWHGKAEGRIKCSLGPHAPDTCPPEFLSKIRGEAERRGLMINTHLAQGDDEVRYVKEQRGKTPTEYLRDEGILGERTFVAHCTRIDDEGIGILAKTKTSIAICPHNYARRGGTTAMMKFIEAGCSVGLGTDGGPDMIRFIEAARMAVAFRNKLVGEAYQIPSAQRVLELATVDAAKVIGMENEVGSLEVGKKADIIVVDMKRPHLTPNVDPVANMVYYGNGNDVRTVVIDGKIVMEDWEIKTIDEEKALERTQLAAEETWTRLYPNSPKPDKHELLGGS